MNSPGQLGGVPNGGSHSDQLMMNASMLFLQQQQQQQQAFQGYSHELSAPPPLIMRQAPADQGGSAGTHAGTVTPTSTTSPPSRYESQKRRDWNTFGQYLKNNRPPLPLARCSGEHVLQFLRYLDQFGKTKVHAPRCPYFGLPHPPGTCECPLRQAWGSLDALIGRLRAAFEEHGGKPESNPFGARAVRIYLREVREMQAKARGIAYEKKKRKRQPAPPPATAAHQQEKQLAEDHSAGNASKAKSELYHQELEGSSSFLVN